MVNPGLFQKFDLPYEPLPEAATQAAFGSITKCGFAREAIEEGYSFSSPNQAQPIKVNALAFAHPVLRDSGKYASFTVFNAVNGHDDRALVELLAESAAPFHLIHHQNTFSFWASDVQHGQVRPIEVKSSIAYEQLGNALSDYAVDLKPQKIIDVKQGRDTFTVFRDMQPLQLSLWAEGVTSKRLVEHFGTAVDSLRSYRPRIPDESITRIAIQLLGALILADTGVLGPQIRTQRPSMYELILIANSAFKLYFQPAIFETYHAAAEKAYYLLQQIRYAGFVPGMLSHLYAKAYDKKERQALGSYDTPLYLTRHIWKNIPVEYLPPNQRVIADLTCGWGSFLVAGHERLSMISDVQGLSLRDYIYGNDKEDFIAQLAGLGLLLSTSEDSWHVYHEDALEWEWFKTHQPNIIVGNPPFSGSRKRSSAEELETSDKEKTRLEKANKFLAFAIERLASNGYLAMIMPRSFTVAEASPGLRKLLLEKCDVLELWELPTDVFPDVTARTIVLFAKKRPESESGKPFHTPVRVRTVQPATKGSFEGSGTFTASGLIIKQSTWSEISRKSKGSKNTYIMDYQVILPEYTWKAIASHCVRTRDMAEIIRGAIVGQKPENKRWTDYEYPKTVPWLTGVKDIMPYPYFIDYKNATTIRYPNDLEEPRKSKNPKRDKEQVLAGKKVLVSYDPDPTWGRRIRVAIERQGYYVSDSFWVVAPKPLAQHMHITCEVLAAVLSWDVANAWIVEYLKNPAIPKRAVDTVPFPSKLTEEDCDILTEAILILEEEAKVGRFESQVTKDANRTIDTILKVAYHLDDATFDRLRKIIEWDHTPQITLDTQPNRNEANWSISGIVDSINAEQGTIILWMEGFSELQQVKIVPSIPGWMLRPEAAFRTKIPRQYVKQGYIDFDTIDWGTFTPQPYAYMSEEELLEEFSNIFREDGRSRVG